MVRPVLLLQLAPTASGGWTVALGAPGRGAVRGEVAPEAVAQVQTEMAALRPAGGRVLLPDDDQAVASAEERVGGALGAALFGTPAAAAALGAARGRAEGVGRPLLVAVDAAPSLASLPWELLAAAPGEPPLEATGAAVILRLEPTATVGPSPPPGRSLGWTCPTPEEPVCAAVVDHLDALRTRHGLEEQVSPALLHVVGHGALFAECTAVLGEGGALHPGTLAHGLAASLETSGLVVLEVCHGAGDGAASLARRLVGAGASACVGPRRPAAAEAARAFRGGLVDTLVTGAPLAEGVAAGRRRLREAALPWPDARWWHWILAVGAVDRAAEPVLTAAVDQPAVPAWWPARWPGPAADAAACLDEAAVLAARLGGGVVGVGHLAEVLRSAPLVDEALALPRAALAAGAPPLGRWMALGPRQAPGEPAPTPRLDRVVSALSEGFSVTDLWAALAADPACPLHALVPGGRLPRPGALGETTWDGRGGAVSREVAATSVEVVGGPEDGRRIALSEGTVLGRVGGGCLYTDAPVVDPRLSRTHAVVQADGAVALRRPAELERGAERRALAAGETVHLRVGDRLWLTPATLVLAGA